VAAPAIRRAFTALEASDGTRRWQTIVDQTITAAQMADDGSIVGSTVGGMAYGVNAGGSIIWARMYGGVGHNGVHYTRNSEYALLGGPNPTLFDGDGNILWQREKDKPVEMTGPAEQDTGGANAVWVSDDASLIILGGDDGQITFYRGEIKASPAPTVTPVPEPTPAPEGVPASQVNWTIIITAIAVIVTSGLVSCVLIRKRRIKEE